MGKRIFYVDDDADDVQIFQDVASLLGHEAITFENVFDFLTALESQYPDLVVVDLNMPQMNGFEVIQKIRSEQALKALPVVIHSTAGDLRSIFGGKASGADMYIRKPDSVRGLREVLSFVTSMDFDRLCSGSQKFFMQVCDSESRKS